MSCFNISFANNDNSSYVFSKNTHGVNNINLQDETLEEEEFEDSESGRIPFEPDRIIPFSEAVVEISDLLNQYKTSNDIDVLKKCILTFGEVPKISESLTNDIVKIMHS